MREFSSGECQLSTPFQEEHPRHVGPPPRYAYQHRDKHPSSRNPQHKMRYYHRRTSRTLAMIEFACIRKRISRDKFRSVRRTGTGDLAADTAC